MKSLLVNIASFAVVLHMTFGCYIHHGQGTNACAHQGATACGHTHDPHREVEHDQDDHQHDDHGHLPAPQSTDEFAGEHPNFGHLGCCEDGCNATQFVAFKFDSIDFSVPYLGGAETLALIKNQNQLGFHVDPFPDCSHTETAVRAHLLFGVQIL